MVVDLLRQRRFEQAFRPLIGDENQSSTPTDEVSLMMMHEKQLANDLGHVLGLKDGIGLQKRHFWTYRQQRYEGQPYVDYMSYYLDILDGKYQDLAQMGTHVKTSFCSGCTAMRADATWSLDQM